MKSKGHNLVDMGWTVLVQRLPGMIAACLLGSCLAAITLPTVQALATMRQVSELETRRFAEQVSPKAAFALARASAWLKAMARAQTSLPARRKLALTDSGGQRLALVAQVYTATALRLANNGWQEHSSMKRKSQAGGQPGLVGVNLTLTPVADAAGAMDLALRNPEFLTMRLALVNETIRIVHIMESHWNERAQAPGQTARQTGNKQLSENASPIATSQANGKGDKKSVDTDTATGPANDQARQKTGAGQIWLTADWERAGKRLEALWRVQSVLDLTPDGWFTAPAALPILENAARACPEMPVILLLLAEAQLQRDLPERSVATCTRIIGLAPAISRARYIRALAHWRLDQPALAETDLNAAINVGQGPKPQGDELARRYRARGALRLTRRNLEGMCADFLAACSLGDCDGYSSARKKGQCLQ